MSLLHEGLVSDTGWGLAHKLYWNHRQTYTQRHETLNKDDCTPTETLKGVCKKHKDMRPSVPLENMQIQKWGKKFN